ncbi:MAG: signal peptidase II [Clostridia bacterium]|nr:signal peptidase II [Clostridia bacterium]
MEKKNRRFYAALILIAAIVVFDQLVKLWADAVLQAAPGQVLPFIPGFMDLRYVQNTGAAFSLFAGATWVLGLISLILAVIIIYFLWRGRRSGSLLYMLSLSFIAGGALGNVIDRFRLGHVVDMLEFQFVQFAIFNVADCFVCVGAVLFAICILTSTDRAKKTETAS